MVITAVNPILALLLAISMLFTPAAGVSTTQTDDLPAFTFHTVIGDESTGYGLVKSTNGESVVYISHNDSALYVNASRATLTTGDRSVAVPVTELLTLLGANSIPEPTEQDVNALMYLAQGLMTGISPASFSFAPTANGFTCKLDLDQLCADLDVAVPQTLTTYSAQLDPTIQKYTAALLGQPFTCAQLAAAWPDLGLGSVSTGFTAQLTVMQQKDGSYTLLGSVMGMNYIGNVSESGFDLRVTTPDGVSYQLDTRDLSRVAALLAELPGHITPEAFSLSTTEGRNDTGETVYIYTMTLDTTALARDLSNGLAAIVSSNAGYVDTLLERYRPWIALFDSSTASTLTAASLADSLSSGLITLPAIHSETVITDNISLRTADFDAYANTYTLTGKIHYDYGACGSLLLANNSRWDALYLDVDFTWDEYGKSMFTFSSSQPVFDAFNTLTLSINGAGWDPSFLITTDTNVFRLIYSAPEQYMEAKIGPASFSFREDENESFHLDAYLPEFFLSMHTGEEFFNLDSTFIGLDVAGEDDNVTISGYVQEDSYSDRATFGLTVNEDASFINAFLHAGYGENYDLTIAGNCILICMEDEIYTITPDYTRQAYVVTCDNEPVATVYGTSEGDKTTLRIYEGLSDDHGAPTATVVMDFAPEAITLPSAEQVDAVTFMNLVNEFLE